jgi:hypothetical protein
MSKSVSSFINEDLQQQHDYVAKLNREGFSFPLIAAEAFVRGMRESGYKSTATAINELIDNAIQAQATRIDIVLGYLAGNKTKAKPDKIAVIDNGHGMEPDMIKAAAMWGGTHRENDRRGFGRFGFGLPSASVSVGKRFSVYSKTPSGRWHLLVIDLEDIAAGKMTDNQGVTMVPHPQPTDLPDFVSQVLPDGDLPHGTIILLEKLDRLSNGYITTKAFRQNELQEVGVTYREVLRTTEMHVIDVGDKTVDVLVDAIDPLFLRADARYYDETDIHADPLPELVFEVKPTEESPCAGLIRVRYAYFPPGFLPEDSKADSPRLKVRKANTGLIMMRNARQVDVVTVGPKFSVSNNDRHWCCEITFDATLDEDFGVTTNKQQIIMKDRIWQFLRANGVISAINQMRTRYAKDHGYSRGKTRQDEAKQSEEIASEASKFLVRKPTKPSVAKEQKNKEAIDKEAERIARQENKPKEEVRAAIEADIEEKEYKVMFESDRGEFYRVEQVGGQKRLYINTSHRFYSDVYNVPGATNRMRTALELLLLTLGVSELESEGDKEIFYRVERGEWTRRLETYLQLLDRRDPVADARAAATVEAESVDEPAA